MKTPDVKVGLITERAASLNASAMSSGPKKYAAASSLISKSEVHNPANRT